MTNASEDEPLAQETAPSSVAHGVLEAFFTELEGADGFESIAKRLRKTVLVEGSFSEASIRKALFEEEPSA